jgi:hypothetical protein
MLGGCHGLGARPNPPPVVHPPCGLPGFIDAVAPGLCGNLVLQLPGAASRRRSDRARAIVWLAGGGRAPADGARPSRARLRPLNDLIDIELVSLRLRAGASLHREARPARAETTPDDPPGSRARRQLIPVGAPIDLILGGVGRDPLRDDLSSDLVIADVAITVGVARHLGAVHRYHPRSDQSRSSAQADDYPATNPATTAATETRESRLDSMKFWGIPEVNNPAGQNPLFVREPRDVALEGPGSEPGPFRSICEPVRTSEKAWLSLVRAGFSPSWVPADGASARFPASWPVAGPCIREPLW